MSTPARAQLDAAVNNLQIQVSRDNVLQVRAALLAEVDRLQNIVQTELLGYQGVGLCGGDPVSPHASAGFNQRIDALISQCKSYSQDLREAASALDATARSYGITEDEIQASFKAAT